MLNSNPVSRLRQVGPDQEVPEAAAPVTATKEAIGLKMILLGLQALGQRALVALAALKVVVVLASVWWLFSAALPTDPSTHQLIGLGLYGFFALAAMHSPR